MKRYGMTGMAVLMLMTVLAGCGGGGTNGSQATVKVTAGAAMDLRSKYLANEAAYIPPMCWTKTEDADGVTIHNPCFTCHTESIKPNYNNDQNLQLSYDFPGYARTNRWSNLFKSRVAQVAAIGDSEILAYIRTDNYRDAKGSLMLRELLKNVPKGWDFNGNGVWDGYSPDAWFSFDQEGFDGPPTGATAAGAPLPITRSPVHSGPPTVPPTMC